jgi:hypothetical protein
VLVGTTTATRPRSSAIKSTSSCPTRMPRVRCRTTLENLCCSNDFKAGNRRTPARTGDSSSTNQASGDEDSRPAVLGCGESAAAEGTLAILHHHASSTLLRWHRRWWRSGGRTRDQWVARRRGVRFERWSSVSRVNPRWGYQGIVGELKALGWRSQRRRCASGLGTRVSDRPAHAGFGGQPQS